MFAEDKDKDWTSYRVEDGHIRFMAQVPDTNLQVSVAVPLDEVKDLSEPKDKEALRLTLESYTDAAIAAVRLEWKIPPELDELQKRIANSLDEEAEARYQRRTDEVFLPHGVVYLGTNELPLPWFDGDDSIVFACNVRGKDGARLGRNSKGVTQHTWRGKFAREPKQHNNGCAVVGKLHIVDILDIQEDHLRSNLDEMLGYRLEAARQCDQDVEPAPFVELAELAKQIREEAMAVEKHHGHR